MLAVAEAYAKKPTRWNSFRVFEQQYAEANREAKLPLTHGEFGKAAGKAYRALVADPNKLKELQLEAERRNTEPPQDLSPTELLRRA